MGDPEVPASGGSMDRPSRPRSRATAGHAAPGESSPQGIAVASESSAQRHPSQSGSEDGGDPAAEPDGSRPRQLHPLPPGLVELYGFLAVLFVLVPEWMASGALFGFREGRRGSELPTPSGAWRRLPELRLATMALAELRLLAQQRGLWGYGRDNRAALTARLLQRLRQRP